MVMVGIRRHVKSYLTLNMQSNLIYTQRGVWMDITQREREVFSHERVYDSNVISSIFISYFNVVCFKRMFLFD